MIQRLLAIRLRVAAEEPRRFGIAAKRTIIDIHLVPHLGWKRLDGIGNEDVPQLKNRLKDRVRVPKNLTPSAPCSACMRLHRRSRATTEVVRSEWRGHVPEPKGGRSRRIPLTGRLSRALKVHEHLRGPRVVCQDDGKPLMQKVVQGLVQRAARKVGLTNSGVHLLRHTFCSHLAMRGASANAIQSWPGTKT